MRTLKRVTTVNRPDRPEHLVLSPGDEIPEWAAEIFDRDPDVYYEDDGDETVGEVVNYADLRVSELSDLVRERGLEPASGKKDDLVAALEADDAGDSGADDE